MKTTARKIQILTLLIAFSAITAQADQAWAWRCVDSTTAEVFREVIPYIGDSSTEFEQKLAVIGENHTRDGRINESEYAQYFLGVKDDTTFDSKSAKLVGQNGVGGTFELVIDQIRMDDFSATGVGTLKYSEMFGTRKSPQRVSRTLSQLSCVWE